MPRIQYLVLTLLIVALTRPVEPGPTVNQTGEDCLCKISNCSPPPGSTTLRKDYQYIPGVGAHKMHTVAKTWKKARRICEEEGGHLAIVNNKGEARVLRELFRQSYKNITGSLYPQTAMLGFHNLCGHGVFTTIFGETLGQAGYTTFAKMEPDNLDGRQRCGSIDLNGKLHDVDGTYKMGFICELPIKFEQGIDTIAIVGN